MDILILQLSTVDNYFDFNKVDLTLACEEKNVLKKTIFKIYDLASLYN